MALRPVIVRKMSHIQKMKRTALGVVVSFFFFGSSLFADQTIVRHSGNGNAGVTDIEKTMPAGIVVLEWVANKVRGI